MRRHSRQIRLGNWSCLVTFKWMGNAWKKLQLELLAYKKCVICSYFAEQNTSSPEQAMIRTFSDFSLVKKISTEFSSLHEHKHNLHMPCSISMLWFSSSISIFILSRSLENFLSNQIMFTVLTIDNNTHTHGISKQLIVDCDSGDF